MSQEDVLRILRRQPNKEFTLEDLAEKLKVKVNNVNVWVNKLDKWGVVRCRKEGGKKYVKLIKK
ncbi:MAG: hypothetical protein QXQ40_01845 [Candidatus Aenigmatarchaeota archaeon]